MLGVILKQPSKREVKILDRLLEPIIVLTAHLVVSTIVMLITRYLLNKNWQTTLSAACGALVISSSIWRIIDSGRMDRLFESVLVLSALLAISIIVMLIVRYLLKKNWKTALSAACAALVINVLIWRYFIYSGR